MRRKGKVRRIKYAVAAALVVASVLVPAIGAAHPTTWVLWNHYHGTNNDTVKYEQGGWQSLFTFLNREQCEKTRAQFERKPHNYPQQYLCLPDNVDPRPRA